MNKKNPSKILIFGKNGQVGYEFCRALSTLGALRAVDIDECDLTDKAAILEELNAFRPSVIANGAAYTAVDKAESDHALAFKLNAEAPAVMAEWAAKNDALMIHCSTDYVFDGTKKEPQTEEDKPNPLNVYGASKLAGDENIQNAGCSHLIFRTSWVYGARGKNFYLTMRRLLLEKEELRVVDDQFGAPTWCRTIAEIAAQALAQIKSPLCDCGAKKLSGVYNLTNSGVTTWYGFTKEIKKRLEKERKEAQNADGRRLAEIVPIASAEYPTPAKRPANSRLSLEKLKKTFGIEPEEWETAMWQA